MNERIRELRKELNLTLEKFSERLGISRGALSNVEIGKRNVTDQLFKSICREFNVNPDWLRNGQGEMFNQLSENEELSLYVGKLVGSDNTYKKKAILNLCKLPDEVWEALKKAAEEAK